MLTSITPLGERGRGNRWGHTAAWLVVGHVVGGALLGGSAAALAAGAAALGVAGVSGAASHDVVVATVAAVAAAAIVFDLAGGRVPGRRQVDERWLTTYRGWVYGLGFGVQLGFGLVTVVNTALVVALLVAVVLVAPVAGVGLGALYGTVRGLAAVGSGRVRSVGDLHRLHRLLDRHEVLVQRFTLGGVALVSIAAVVAASG